MLPRTIPPGSKRIAPGIYSDGAGGMHIDAAELLEAHGFEPTPENEDRLEAELGVILAAYGFEPQ